MGANGGRPTSCSTKKTGHQVWISAGRCSQSVSFTSGKLRNVLLRGRHVDPQGRVLDERGSPVYKSPPWVHGLVVCLKALQYNRRRVSDFATFAAYRPTGHRASFGSVMQRLFWEVAQPFASCWRRLSNSPEIRSVNNDIEMTGEKTG